MVRAHVKSTLLAGVISLAHAPAWAHPHVFIDTGLEVIFDAGGRVVALRIAWAYDALYSMLMIDELGLDPEFTGNVTPEERAALSGFDMNWDPGYEGDIYPLFADRPVALEPPESWTADYRDGRIISTHLRRFAEPLALGADTPPLVVQVYDPTYYVSYTILDGPLLTGREDCTARIFEPDWGAASARLQDALDELVGAGGDIEADFPAVGAEFAEELRVSCGG